MLVSELITELQRIQEMNPNAKVFIEQGSYFTEIKKEDVIYDCEFDCIIKNI